MKYRLQRDYSTLLNFHPSKDCRVSELVTRHDALLAEIVDDVKIITPRVILSSITSSTDDNSASSGLEYSDLFDCSRASVPNQNLELYHAALTLKEVISNTAVTIQHPPTTYDMSINNARDAVPPQLFNFMCVMTGLIEEFPEDMDAYAVVDSYEKIMSVCSDLVGISGKTNPKALALGLTVRHATGSKYLLNLLHGLGHSASYDKVLRAETAIAKQQSANQEYSYMPEGFECNQPTILVYDNIDFQEETLSGAGSSHYTNGIMFQIAQSGSTLGLSRKVVVPTSKRTFTPTKHDVPAYHQFRKDGPQKSAIANPDIASFLQSKSTDENYLVLKLADGPSPGTWTGINIRTTTPLDRSVIHYLPIIEASPTDPATVRHVLAEAIKMADTLQCPTVMVVFDQAIYYKAQVIRWVDEDIRDRLLPRLGELHTIMSFTSAIGKRFARSGLEDLLVEAEVIAGGSMKGFISGHMYNRAIRGHKLLFEALGLLQLKEFIETCSPELLEELQDGISMLELRLSTGVSLSSDPSTKFLTAFHTHSAKRCSESPMYAFWNSYLEMVAIVLSFIRGTRTGDFSLHLSSLRQMLPWFFAYDRTNYAR